MGAELFWERKLPQHDQVIECLQSGPSLALLVERLPVPVSESSFVLQELFLYFPFLKVDNQNEIRRMNERKEKKCMASQWF